MIADMAAMAPEARTGAGAAMFLERPHRNAKIVCGLFGAQERGAAQCEARAGDLIIVVHGFDPNVSRRDARRVDRVMPTDRARGECRKPALAFRHTRVRGQGADGAAQTRPKREAPN
nr:hypothetical protein [uncultured bacterium]